MTLLHKLLCTTSPRVPTLKVQRVIVESLENRTFFDATIASAAAIGTLVGKINFNDSVNAKNDAADYRSLTLSAPGTLTINLNCMSANADLTLIHDANHNGKVDTGEMLAASSHTGKTAESIAKSLPAGTYIVGVLPGPNACTNYHLAFIADYAGKTPAAAREAGTLATAATFQDFIGPTDPNDYYRIELSSSQKVAVAVGGISSSVGVQIIQQTPGAGATQTLKVLASSAISTASGSIQKTLPAGTYFIRVLSRGCDTNYKLTLSSTPTTTPGLHIVFDYRFDSTGFFVAHPQAKTLLDTAAAAFSVFTDQLQAITPSAGNTWAQTFDDPTTNVKRVVKNATIAANTIVIYVGASSHLNTLELGEAAPGGFTATGFTDWLTTIESRGQTHAMDRKPTDFGPWGGAISFSSTAHWNFSAQAPPANENDFLSVATHEIAHVLGIGTSGSWMCYVTNHRFTGPHAEKAFGGPVPLSSNDDHWASSTVSKAGTTPQAAEMDPTLPVGQRRAMTALDYAGLQDVGWQLP